VIKDRELVCAPINSPQGKRYFGAMCAGINCALANRQIIAHLVRQVVAQIFPEALVKMLYDVSHNTCKVESHEINGKIKKLYVHRKGATRAFGPGRRDLPREYRDMGQPVLIGGSMGTSSYILIGTDEGMKTSFGSACHGAGRAFHNFYSGRKRKKPEICSFRRFPCE
jgi:tRNA-splicing ligase RtcB